MQFLNLFVVLIVIFMKRTFNLQRDLTTYSERMKNVRSRNVYEVQETLFDKLDSFGNKYTSEQKLQKFSNTRRRINLCPRGDLQRQIQQFG